MIFCHESFARRNLFVPLYSLGIVLFPPYGIALFGKQWCCHVSKFCLGMHWLPVQSRRLWGHWDLARSPSAQGSGSAARARLRHSEKPLWCLKEFHSSVSTPCSGFLPPILHKRFAQQNDGVILTSPAGATSTEGAGCTELFCLAFLRRERSKVPYIVRQCVEEIERRGMEEVGIYRVSGVATDIQALKAAFDVSK